MKQELIVNAEVSSAAYQLNIIEVYQTKDRIIVFLEPSYLEGSAVAAVKATASARQTIDTKSTEKPLPVSYYLVANDVVANDAMKSHYSGEQIVLVTQKKEVSLSKDAMCLYNSRQAPPEKSALLSTQHRSPFGSLFTTKTQVRSPAESLRPSEESPSEQQPLPTLLEVSQLPGSNNEALDNTICISAHYNQADKNFLVGIKSSINPMAIYYPVKFVESIDKTKIAISRLLREEHQLCVLEKIDIALIEQQDKSEPILSLSCEVLGTAKKPKANINIKTDALIRAIHAHLAGFPITPGQRLMIPYPESSTNTMTVETKITAINGVHVDEANDSSLYYRLQPSSELNLTVSPSLKLITLTGLNSSLPSFSLDFSVKGVGGHKKQLASLLRDIFFSRAMPAEYAAEYGVNHTKGILLYGPPGTGKTLIGRVIGSMLTQEDKIKVVNGPELKNKYVGEGAKNLRDVFAEADAEWAAKGPESDTHVIIFDEIDALCPERGSRSGGTGSDEDMVSTLLTKLDGVKQQHNFVIIGTTNRPDLIDPALKRPGRLECHVEIGLPDEKDRLEILTIKIADMRKHELVDETVYLGYWAEQTKNYTGAELEELVKKAVHHAMGANFTLEPETGTLSFSKEIKDKSKLAKVAQEHFIKAFAEILPAFGTDKQFNQFKKTNFTLYSKTIESIVERFKGALALLNSREDMSNYQLLIAGPNGSGKTNLALYLAEQSNAKYVKVITAEKLLSYPLTKQFEYLDEQFANASRVEFSVLILEDLENLIGADAELRDYNNNLRLKLGSCLKALEQSNHKCVVIATTQKQSFIKRIKLGDTFSESFELSTISLEFNGLETTENLMSILCRSLGFEGKVLAPSHSDRDEPRKIELPIRELVYQIKKFLFERTRKEAFSLDEFYQFVNPVRAATSSNRLSYDELDEDLSRALGAGASSVFHRS